MERIPTHTVLDRRETRETRLDERRAEQRIAVHFYIAVKQNGKHLGHIINLSTSGMAVVGKISLAPEQAVSLRVEADLEDGNLQLAEFDAKCIFSVKHIRPGLFISGFLFETLTPKARIRIKNILRALKDSRRVTAA